MKRMRKLTALVLGIAFMLTALAGCSGVGTTVEAPPAVSEDVAPAEPAQNDDAAAPAEAADDKITIAFCEQLKGINYWVACEKGALKAAEQLDIEFIYDGPTDGRSDHQIEMIEAWIQMGVDAICVAPVDSAAILPTLKKAMDAGIVILTFDVDTTEEDARDWFIDAADATDVGETLMKLFIEEAGEEGTYVMMCEKLTDVMQATWTSAAQAYQEANYPNMKFIELKQCGSMQEDAYSMAKDILKAYPDLTGIVTAGAPVYTGTAEAVMDAGMGGKIVLEGVATPNEVRQFIKDGVIKYDVLWNPIDLGYAVVMAAYSAAKGDLTPGDTTFDCGDLGTLDVAGKKVGLGDPYVFDINNVDDFDF